MTDASATANAKADARDDVVYSNLAYILPALFAPTYAAQVILSLTGAALVGGSAVYHATHTREGQSLDVSAMMTYVAALACGTCSVGWPAPPQCGCSDSRKRLLTGRNHFF